MAGQQAPCPAMIGTRQPGGGSDARSTACQPFGGLTWLWKSSHAPISSCGYTHSYFSERHSRSMKMLSGCRPRPSIDILAPDASTRPVHCEPWPVLKILGAPPSSASSSATRALKLAENRLFSSHSCVPFLSLEHTLANCPKIGEHLRREPASLEVAGIKCGADEQAFVKGAVVKSDTADFRVGEANARKSYILDSTNSIRPSQFPWFVDQVLDHTVLTIWQL